VLRLAIRREVLEREIEREPDEAQSDQCGRTIGFSTSGAAWGGAVGVGLTVEVARVEAACARGDLGEVDAVEVFAWWAPPVERRAERAEALEVV